MLGTIKAYTYDKEDLQQHRLGLIADQVQEAIQELGIDNVVSEKWHREDNYTMLDYGRHCVLCIATIQELHQQLKDLKSKDGTTS